MSQDLKLTIELVPSTSWCNNIRKAVSQTDWDKIRRGIYAQYDHRCGICQSDSKLNCHEIWHYDDEQHLQTLAGFIALCDLCHHVKHIGFAGILAKKGLLNFDQVVQHFMKVNACNRLTFGEHKSESFGLWKKRSLHEWTVDLGQHQSMIQNQKKTSG